MANDQQTYQRGTQAAIVGLITQLVLAVVMAVLGLYADSNPLHIATWYFFGGVGIWIVLAVLEHQHRLERAEALEAEQLARADARTAALFDEAGQQLQLAHRRLERLYRFALPIVSGLTGAYLLVVGGVYFYLNWRDVQAGVLSPDLLRGTASTAIVAVVALVIAFVGFLVARYVAGMTQSRQWQILRGGAAYLLGNSVVAALSVLAFGGLAVGLEAQWALAGLALVVPALMGLLGIEIAFSLVLGLYRPRKPDEPVRPAFDSRLLGFLTRPDSLGRILSETLNYQFGFEISRSWFYRLLGRAVTPLVIVAILVLLGLSSLVFVAPYERAGITRFGDLTRIVGPGLHVKWPWPAGGSRTVNVDRVQSLILGSPTQEPASTGGETEREAQPVLWTQEHASEEEHLITAPSRLSQNVNASRIGLELTGARIMIKYRVDPDRIRAFLTAAAHPRRILHDVAAGEMTRAFATHTLVQLLMGERLELGEQLQQRIQRKLNRIGARGLGIEVVQVGVLNVHPPQASEVAASFHTQISELIQRSTTVEQAQSDAIDTLAQVAGSSEQARRIVQAVNAYGRLRQQLQSSRNQSPPSKQKIARLRQRIDARAAAIEDLLARAGGQAAQRIYQARAYRWQQVMREKGRAARFTGRLADFNAAPRYYRRRLYLATLADALARQRKTVMAAEEQQPPLIRLNLESEQAGIDSILNSDNP